MTSPRNRYKIILEWQKKILLRIGAGLMALTALSGVYQTVDHIQTKQHAQVVAQRNEFWQVVARQKQPNASNVKNSFAITLRDKLGPIGADETELPAEITDFRAGPNAFGGIETELGFVPFDNTGQQCLVCGSLNADMKTKLLQIKQGNLSTVLGQEEATIGDITTHLTPLGIPTWLWLGFVYAGSTTAALMLAIRRDSRLHRYHPGTLNWKEDGDTTTDSCRRQIKLISPMYFMAILPMLNRVYADDSFDEVLRLIGLGDSWAKARLALIHIEALPPGQQNDPDVMQQRQLAESILAKIDYQVECHTLGEDPGEASRKAIANIQTLTRDAAFGVGSRQAALSEVSQIDSSEDAWMEPLN